MNKYEKEEDKLQMLEAMRNFGWTIRTNENSSYEEVEEDFNNMIVEKEAIESELGLDEDD
jgi:hypothetical protein